MAANSQVKKPNIIFILADDVGYKTPSCDGGKSYPTPHIDSLAQNGMRFTQCHASPSCSPSRFMLLTGKYNFRNYAKWGSMDADQKTLGNLFKDAGYNTGYFGKWQLNGGDQSVKEFGFNSYCIWDAFGDLTQGSRYKNPKVYVNGSYLSADQITNKYSEDIFTDSILNFLDKNKDTSFFIYYSMVLVHGPFGPTPDDSTFDTWQNKTSDTSYYSSMVRYMDKKLGSVVSKVKSLGLENNTIIIFTGDNGTSNHIMEIDDSLVSLGGKFSTTESGTHVPLIFSWPTTIKSGLVNNSLIDFTDFLPTLANLTNINIPKNYGTIDGVNFAGQLAGADTLSRSWSFNHYDVNPSAKNSSLQRWAQTNQYKLYDTSSSGSTRLFYDILHDPQEKRPLPDDSLSATELLTKQELLDVINNYIYQGKPLLSVQPSISFINDTAVVFNDTIRINGGSTITKSGIVWSTSPYPVTSSSFKIDINAQLGVLSAKITGLLPNTNYYIRSYATNLAGIAYGKQIIIKTSTAPVAIAASSIDSGAFTANWKSFPEATSYKFDLSLSPTFNQIKSFHLEEDFNNGALPPAGWNFSNNIIADSNDFKTKSPSVEFTESGASIVTKQLPGAANELKFWVKGINTNNKSILSVEGFDGYTWTTIATISDFSNYGATRTYNSTSSIPLQQKFIQFRFTYTKNAGNVALDDLSIYYDNPVDYFVDGYDNKQVNTISQIVLALNSNTHYYYRIRAQVKDTLTNNSNIIDVKTCSKPIIKSIIKKDINCYGNNDGSITINVSGGIEPVKFEWSGPDNFKDSTTQINNLFAGIYNFTAKSLDGCSSDTIINIISPEAITSTLKYDSIICQGNSTKVTINANGGTRMYTYALINKNDTSSFQSNSSFKVYAGNYNVLIKDNHSCLYKTKAFTVKEINCDTALDDHLQVDIFPNPSSTEFKLKVLTATNQTMQIYVTDALGKRMYHDSGDKNKLFVFGRTFAPGIYFLHVMQDGVTTTKKIIKAAR